MDLPGKEKEKEKRCLFFESGLDLRRPLPHLLGLFRLAQILIEAVNVGEVFQDSGVQGKDVRLSALCSSVP
jgi:hypothetical protein